MSEDAKETNVPLVTEEPKKKKFGTVKKVILGFVVVVAAIIGFTYYTTAGASKAADEFLGYVQAVDSDSAYSLLSTDAKESGTRESFDLFVVKVGPVLSGSVSKDGVGVSAGTGQETVSTVKYKIQGTDGKTYMVVIELVKEDGKWRVLNFDSDLVSEEESEVETQ